MKIKAGALTSVLFGNNIEHIVKEASVNIKNLGILHEKTSVVNINTVNGCFREGAMYSLRLEKIIPKIVRVNEFFSDSHKIFFIDRHKISSSELKDYPIHCTTEHEQKIISQLEKYTENADIFFKNCTNAFFAKSYAKWLALNSKNKDTYIITGGMSDICVMQFALTQKAYFNNINRSDVRIIVAVNATQTYDSETHCGDLMHSFALYNMYLNGVILAYI